MTIGQSEQLQTESSKPESPLNNMLINLAAFSQEVERQIGESRRKKESEGPNRHIAYDLDDLRPFGLANSVVQELCGHDIPTDLYPGRSIELSLPNSPILKIEPYSMLTPTNTDQHITVVVTIGEGKRKGAQVAFVEASLDRLRIYNTDHSLLPPAFRLGEGVWSSVSKMSFILARHDPNFPGLEWRMENRVEGDRKYSSEMGSVSGVALCKDGVISVSST